MVRGPSRRSHFRRHLQRRLDQAAVVAGRGRLGRLVPGPYTGRGLNAYNWSLRISSEGVWRPAASDGREGAAVDDVFGTGDSRCAVGHEEGDQLGDLIGMGRPAEGNAAKGVHELL